MVWKDIFFNYELRMTNDYRRPSTMHKVCQLVWCLNFRGLRHRAGKEFEKLESFFEEKAKNFRPTQAETAEFSGRNCHKRMAKIA